MGKINVTFFQRRPREQGNYCIEFIFNDLRNRLKDKILSDVKLSKFYNNGFLPRVYNIIEAAFRQRSSISHITGEVNFLALLMKKKRVLLTVLDCGILYNKTGIIRYLTKLVYFTLPIRRSKYVTAISENTKQEIIDEIRCPPDKIIVIPVSVDSIYQAYPKQFKRARPNILHIGLAYNKNIFRLIEALRGVSCHLTVVGKLLSNHIYELNQNNISFDYRYNLSQMEMLAVYKECDILAFISTFEGFGMPIVEANSVERVVITSNLSAMPEIAGDAAHLVDPYEVTQIRSGLIKVINDEDYREKLINNGRRNKLRFDPNKIAACYYDLYNRIAETSDY